MLFLDAIAPTDFTEPGTPAFFIALILIAVLLVIGIILTIRAVRKRKKK